MFSFFPFLFCNQCFGGLWILHRYRVAFQIHNSTLRNFVSSSRNQIFRFCFLKLYFFLFIFTAKVICAVLATVNNSEINRIKHFSSQNKLYSDEIKVWGVAVMNEGFSEKFDDGPFNKNECLRLRCFKISRKKENLINIHFWMHEQWPYTEQTSS